MNDSTFHPAGPPAFEKLHKAACPTCAGDVKAVEVAGLLAYWTCLACGAIFPTKIVSASLKQPDGADK